MSYVIIDGDLIYSTRVCDDFSCGLIKGARNYIVVQIFNNGNRVIRRLMDRKLYVKQEALYYAKEQADKWLIEALNKESEP